MILEHNTRVYYTGDMANIESEGTICKVNNSPEWGLSYDIVLDDGRLLRGIHAIGFNPSPGRRFFPLAEWMALRAERLKQAQERYQEILARQT
jgi:hypothetical protein